ncbi:hypothetical protein BDZ91DRAFT_40992 [Kalaharituber pfeilii]|nr:hypothetical protein BDZ91DRAFT_40992 [Kalaharituber pfeilii]
MDLPPLSSPPAARDSASPISDCIVVRDSDSSSVITVDTGITSILPTCNASKTNSRAGSVSVPNTSPDEMATVDQVPTKAVETEPQPTLEPELVIKAEPETEHSTAQPTRVLRQRPPRPPPKSPRSAKKPTVKINDEQQPASQLPEVIEIKDVLETVMVKDVDDANRRRSSRLSLLANSPNVSENTLTPKRDAGKRTHDVMNAGSRSANAKLGSNSWKAEAPGSKRAKVETQAESEEDEEDESEDSDEQDESSKNGGNVVTDTAPKRRKIWATQGLFVGQEEDFDPRRRTKRGRLSGAGDAPKKRKSILPLPMFHGLALMDNRRDFKLPFDIFSPSPYKVHPPGWKILSRNILVGDAKDLWKSETEPTGKCVCTPEKGCDEDCLNRCVYYECNDENCNVGSKICQNRQFAALKRRVMKKTKFAEGVEVIQTKDRGFGLRAIRSFEPNEIIVEYCGEIISQEETEKRMRKVYKNNSCYYLMLFDQSMIIDATRGSIARFVNHSCEPNCRMEKWIVDNKPRMALFAGENGVETGEELTYDYNFNWFSGVSQQVCRCGSAKCRGAMGKRTDGRKPVEEKEKSKVVKKKKINRMQSSITVGTGKSAKKDSTAKSLKQQTTKNRTFKVVKKTIIKRTINKQVVKQTVLKGRPSAAPKPLKLNPKPASSSMSTSMLRRTGKTYASASRSIKVESPEEGESAGDTARSSTEIRGASQRPRRTAYGTIQNIAKSMSEKSGLQGTVLDTIVVVG